MCVTTVEMKNVSEAIQIKIQQRQTANLEIVNILYTLAENFPDLRFSQILKNIGLDNISSIEESTVTLEKIRKRLQ